MSYQSEVRRALCVGRDYNALSLLSGLPITKVDRSDGLFAEVNYANPFKVEKRLATIHVRPGKERTDGTTLVHVTTRSDSQSDALMLMEAYTSATNGKIVGKKAGV